MNGCTIMRMGGPVAWGTKQQWCMKHSSCKAEILEINFTTKKTLHLSNIGQDLDVSDIYQPTNLFNKNHSCVNWSKSTTTKGLKHLNLHKNAI